MTDKKSLYDDASLAIDFIQKQVRTIGLGYHIDTDYSDYIKADNQPLYNRSESFVLNSALDAAINICEQFDIDPYEIALNEMTKLEKN